MWGKRIDSNVLRFRCRGVSERKYYFLFESKVGSKLEIYI